MKKFSHWLALIGLMLFGLTGAVRAQDAGQPFAAVTENSLSVYGINPDPISISNPANNGIFSVVWSPDGSKLAYILNDTNFQANLMVADITDSPIVTPVMLQTGGLESGFPISFTDDGNLIYVARATAPANPPDAYRAEIRQIAPDANAQPQTLGSIAFQSGCGGGSPIPGDWRYWEETGFGGNYLTLKLTDFGLLHSTNCTGTGLALLDPQSGTDKPVGPDTAQLQNATEGYGRVTLSPDGKSLAGLYTTSSDTGGNRTLRVIDLATLEAADVKTVGVPEQIAWGIDGTLFYTTQTVGASLIEGLTDEQRQKLRDSGFTDYDPHTLLMAIHHVNPSTGDDQVVYQAEAYQIGRMAVTADGGSLIFSQIANLDAWIHAIGDGSLNPMQDTNGAAQRALVPISLYKLPLDGGDAIKLGDNLSQFVLQPIAMG